MAACIVGFLLLYALQIYQNVPCLCLIAQKMPCRSVLQRALCWMPGGVGGAFKLRDLRAVWVWLLRVPDGVRRGLSYHKDECSVYRFGCALLGMDAAGKQR